MIEFFRRLTFGLILLMTFSVCLWKNGGVAEAKANITWHTTDVVLDFRKCTVKGYFENTGDVGGTVTKMSFIVDVLTSKNGSHVYSATWEHSPKNCYIPAGSKKNWSFWYNDNGCPSWSDPNKKLYPISKVRIWTR